MKPKIVMIIIATLFLSLAPRSARAGWYSVNIDKELIAKMGSIFGSEEGTELATAQNKSKILEHYEAAALSTAGIFLSKSLEFKAKNDLSGFSSADENYYYKKIYHLADKILVKVVSCTSMCLADPSTALYWGSFIMKVLEDTKSLCEQFEAIVTNGKLSFSSIQFLTVSASFKQLIDYEHLGGVDWRNRINSLFSPVNVNYTREELQDELIALGVAGVRSIGGHTAPSDILASCGFGNTIMGKINDVRTMANGVTNVLSTVQNGISDEFLSLIGASGDISVQLGTLFDSGNYDISRWQTDNSGSPTNQYYKQKAYIQSRMTGRDVILEHNPQLRSPNPVINDYGMGEYPADGYRKLSDPPQYNKNIWSDDGRKSIYFAYRAADFDCGADWLSNNLNNWFYNQEEVNWCYNNTYNHTGWNPTKVQQLNAESSGHQYEHGYYTYEYYESITESRPNYEAESIFQGYYQPIKHSCHVYYGLRGIYQYVARSYDWRQNVEEAEFDSYYQDWNIFVKQMNQKCEEWNRKAKEQYINVENIVQANGQVTQSKEPNPYYGMTFSVTYGPKVYYTRDDAAKLKGATKCVISVTCNDKDTLANGSLMYKCRHCDNTNVTTRYCAWESSRSGSYDEDIANIDNAISEQEAKRSSLDQKRRELNALNQELYEIIVSDNTSVSQKEAAREDIKKNNDKINDLEAEINEIDNKLSELRRGKQEVEEERMSSTDTYQRIPSQMANYAAAYQLQWLDDGQWIDQGSRQIFVRKAKMANIRDESHIITYTAIVSTQRKARYFLGIRIHRHQVKIEDSLIGAGTSTTAVAELSLDPNASEESNAEIVNAKIAEVQASFPSCTVSTEYEYQRDNPTDDIPDTYHYLWAGERLQLARDIEFRMTSILTDLIILEKYLHYKYSILDWLQQLTIGIRHDVGQRRTALDEAHYRWMHNAGSKYYIR